MKKNDIIKYFGLALILSFLAFFIRDYFVSFSASQVLGETIQLSKSRNLPYQFLPNTLFILSFGIVPFLYLTIRNITKLSSLKKSLITYVLIVGFGILFWAFRVIYLKYKAIKIEEFLKLSEFSRDYEIERIRFEEMNFDLFLFVGFIFGALFSLLIFRQEKVNI